MLQPRGRRPTNRRICATRRQNAIKRLCLIPQGRIREVSTEVWLNPRELQASCVPRTGLAVPRTLPPKRSGLPGLTSVADDALRFGVTQHISVVLTVLDTISRAWEAGCEAGRAVTEVAAVQLQSCWRSQDRVVPNEIVLRLTLKAAAEVCCNPPSISISDLPGPTTTGDRSSPRRRGTSASLH